MKYNIPILLLLFFAATANSQISRQFTVDVTRAPVWSDTRSSVFTGTFTIRDIPEPNKRVKVGYTLEVIKELPESAFAKEDWALRLYYYDNVVQVLGDTLFVWPGPHYRGQIYTGSFEFMPLVSGNWDITFYYQGHEGYLLPSNYLKGISLQWCIDEDGTIHYLGPKRYDIERTCENARVSFFSKDSVFFKLFPEQRGQESFEYEIMVAPLPKIGDTSTILFDLKANKDIPEGCRIDLHTFGLTLPIPPDKLSPPFYKGQEILYVVKIVPMSFRDEHRITLILMQNGEFDNNHLTQAIGCSMIFDDDNNLRYFCRSTDGLPENKYSSRLPEAGSKIKPRRLRLDIDQDKINDRWEILRHLEKQK
ncbi:MAG: hypothetical protein CVT49_06935 [candidate division Zixibacteria bacterium HGW-Zixibacteria-1]|nr:MAG: hypothetical protein CVT49_06935 [candidate division Zixibacteria bacterium HGW-Zixibacteria-1]